MKLIHIDDNVSEERILLITTEFKNVIDSYKKLGYDVSYINLKIQKQPVHTDGSNSDMNPNLSGGSHTKVGFLQINPDAESVVITCTHKELTDPKSWFKYIIAHELAHEIDNSFLMKNQSKRTELLNNIKSSNFSSFYLKQFHLKTNPITYDKELIAEYFADMICKDTESHKFLESNTSSNNNDIEIKHNLSSEKTLIYLWRVIDKLSIEARDNDEITSIALLRSTSELMSDCIGNRFSEYTKYIMNNFNKLGIEYRQFNKFILSTINRVNYSMSDFKNVGSFMKQVPYAGFPTYGTMLANGLLSSIILTDAESDFKSKINKTQSEDKMKYDNNLDSKQERAYTISNQISNAISRSESYLPYNEIEDIVTINPTNVSKVAIIEEFERIITESIEVVRTILTAVKSTLLKHKVLSAIILSICFYILLSKTYVGFVKEKMLGVANMIDNDDVEESYIEEDYDGRYTILTEVGATAAAAATSAAGSTATAGVGLFTKFVEGFYQTVWNMVQSDPVHNPLPANAFTGVFGQIGTNIKQNLGMNTSGIVDAGYKGLDGIFNTLLNAARGDTPTMFTPIKTFIGKCISTMTKWLYNMTGDPAGGILKTNTIGGIPYGEVIACGILCAVILVSGYKIFKSFMKGFNEEGGAYYEDDISYITNQAIYEVDRLSYMINTKQLKEGFFDIFSWFGKVVKKAYNSVQNIMRDIGYQIRKHPILSCIIILCVFFVCFCMPYQQNIVERVGSIASNSVGGVVNTGKGLGNAVKTAFTSK